MKKITKNTFRDVTTFHVGGEIGYYAELENEDEIRWAVKIAKEKKIKMFILGGGSDFLAGDGNFEDFVVKYVGKKHQIEGDLITAEAGMSWDDLVEYSVENKLQGIECLSGIPGTVGAAPIQNIGAYGQELKDTFLNLTAYDIVNEKFVNFNNDDCHFGYRESIFKEKSHWQKYIIVNLTLKLYKNAQPTVAYESLKGHIIEKPTLSDVRNAILEIRREKLEDPGKVGNAGSFFKNPIVNRNEKEKLEKQFEGIKIFPFGDNFKVSAAWLIERTGWKGKTYKEAGVSPKHALILINRNNKATADHIMELSEKIIEDVNNKFGIKLEREVQLINF